MAVLFISENCAFVLTYLNECLELKIKKGENFMENLVEIATIVSSMRSVYNSMTYMTVVIVRVRIKIMKQIDGD